MWLESPSKTLLLNQRDMMFTSSCICTDNLYKNQISDNSERRFKSEIREMKVLPFLVLSASAYHNTGGPVTSAVITATPTTTKSITKPVTTVRSTVRLTILVRQRDEVFLRQKCHPNSQKL